MKVTSFDISKKLAEIGFGKDHDYYYKFGCDTGWVIEIGWASKECGDIPAYDLETILNALPMGIDRNDKRYDLVIEQRVFFYYSDDDGNELEEFSIMQEGDESLADTAARLLIKLYEVGLKLYEVV